MTPDNRITPEFEAVMNDIARALDDAFNGEHRGGTAALRKRATGFVLLTFPFDGRDGKCNYISNGASREDMVVMFKELIARFEGQPQMRGQA